MTDKQYMRARKIREDLDNLEWVKRELKKAIHISINLKAVEMLREPFIKAVEQEIDRLNVEYESL